MYLVCTKCPIAMYLVPIATYIVPIAMYLVLPCCYVLNAHCYVLYVTGSAKRYTNAQAMIFLYKRCCSKTRNIFYSLKKIFFGA